MPPRRYAALAALAALALFALSLLLPAGREFWYHYFVAPVLADARGEKVDGVGAMYNPFNTLAYALGFYLGFLGVHQLLDRWRIALDERFVVAALPLVVLGGASRALEDAGLFDEPVQYAFISPLIYFLLAAAAVALLALGAWLRRRAGDPLPTGLALLAAAFGAYGTWWLLVPGVWVHPAAWALLLLAVAGTTAYLWGGRPLRDPVLLLGLGGILALGLALLHLAQYPLERPAVLWRTLGLAVLLTAAVAGAALLLGRRWPAAAMFVAPLNLLLYLAHFIDGAATFIGIEYHGYREKHVVPTWFISQAEATAPGWFLENVGAAAVMLPLKFVVVTVAVWLLARAERDQPEQRGMLNLLLLFLLTLGLAPGTRDLLRLALGV